MIPVMFNRLLLTNIFTTYWQIFCIMGFYFSLSISRISLTLEAQRYQRRQRNITTFYLPISKQLMIQYAFFSKYLIRIPPVHIAKAKSIILNWGVWCNKKMDGNRLNHIPGKFDSISTRYQTFWPLLAIVNQRRKVFNQWYCATLKYFCGVVQTKFKIHA